MTTVEDRIIKIIEANREKIITFARDIFTHAELGYKELRTSGKFAEFLADLGLRIEKNLAITGVKAYLKPERPDVSVALIGELDALRVPLHPNVNPETQAAHACGHHAQLAGIVGAAIALSDPEIITALDGQVVFFAVPSEEYGEIEFKNTLRNEGKIQYGGGKSELIRIGAFDDINLSLAHHLSPDDIITLGRGSNTGFVSKIVHYRGKAAHAAAAPEKGVNALNAASLGLQALAFQRETFRDEDSVRIHPIITKGGDLVNVVPDEVVIETLVRAGNIDAILQADTVTDRAFKAGAEAVGAGYEITTLPGYLPVIPGGVPNDIAEAAAFALPGKKIRQADASLHTGGSTDVGDLQHIMPVLCFTTNGCEGGLHSTDFKIIDEDSAYVAAAKIFALAAYRLLRNGAASAKKIIGEYKPVFTKQTYVGFMNGLTRFEKKERLPSKPDSATEKVSLEDARKACRHFAMLYFNFCKTLVDRYGEEEAFDLAQRAVFNLSLDRTDRARQRAAEKGVEPSLENFSSMNDLPYSIWKSWQPCMGGVRCPYAEVWLEYFEKHQWFKRFASRYCDVIDTTNIENYTRNTSHRLTKNLLWGNDFCDREYFPVAQMQKGAFTYGKREN